MSQLIPIANLSGSLSSMGSLSGSMSAVGGLEGQISLDLTRDHKYVGPYQVVPRKVSQELETNNKFMVDNVLVEEITYSETSNPFGGETVIIGYE